MSAGKSGGRRAVRPEAEDRGAQAAALGRRERAAGRIPAGDEGIKPNPDAHPVTETVSDAE